MNQVILPGPRRGTAEIPASKSRAHRLLICAALTGRETELICRGISRDIEATVRCLRAMGHRIEIRGDRIRIQPGAEKPEHPAELRCGESGSTLRFLLPVAGALGLEGSFFLEGRLPERPLQPLEDVLSEKGMRLEREGSELRFSGRLRPGAYEIPGNISSQYVTGLLFALPLLDGQSTLTVTGPIESADYIAMTEEALEQFGIAPEKRDGVYHISPEALRTAAEENSPRVIRVEADWSSAAFPLAMGALSPEGVTVWPMNRDSRQGDRRILSLLEEFGARAETEEDRITLRRGTLRGMNIDASAIPDLVPVLAAVAAGAEGETVIRHAERLRLKESDRLQSTAEMLRGLGAEVRETADGLIIRGKTELRGGRVSSWNDHRIAMAAAVAAGLCREPVEITDAECTEKSFPGFWELMDGLKGGQA